MRSIILASLVMFSVHGFAAQGIGAPTADLVGEGDAGVHKGVVKGALNLSLAAAQKAEKGAKSGIDKAQDGWDMFRDNPFQATKTFVLWVPKKVASKVVSTSLVVEYRDVDGAVANVNDNDDNDDNDETDDDIDFDTLSVGDNGDFDDLDSYRLLWNVQTSPLVKDEWVALEFTVKAENGEGIDLSYAKATVKNIMTKWNVDVALLSYIYSQNQELVQDLASTKQVNLVSLSANDDDLLGKDWSVYGVEIALVASWEIAAAVDADDLDLGDVKIDMSACLGASFAKSGWSVTPEYCRVDNNVFGIESDIVQVTVQKQGASWSLAAGNRQDEINGDDAGEMNYIRFNKFFMPNKNTGIPPVQPKK